MWQNTPTSQKHLIYITVNLSYYTNLSHNKRVNVTHSIIPTCLITLITINRLHIWAAIRDVGNWNLDFVFRQSVPPARISLPGGSREHRRLCWGQWSQRRSILYSQSRCSVIGYVAYIIYKGEGGDAVTPLGQCLLLRGSSSGWVDGEGGETGGSLWWLEGSDGGCEGGGVYSSRYTCDDSTGTTNPCDKNTATSRWLNGNEVPAYHIPKEKINK